MIIQKRVLVSVFCFQKNCRHREIIYVEDDFYKWAGYSCYNYGSPLRFKNGSKISSYRINGIKNKVPCAEHVISIISLT